MSISFPVEQKDTPLHYQGLLALLRLYVRGEKVYYDISKTYLILEILSLHKFSVLSQKYILSKLNVILPIFR